MVSNAISTVLRLALVATLVQAACAGQFTNGGFESPELAKDSSLGFGPQHSGLTGWTMQLDGVLLVNGFPPHSIGAVDGAQYVIFGVGSRPTGSSAAQTFNTKPGHTYTVGYCVGKVGGAPGLVEVTAVATADDGAVLSLSAGSQSTVGWGGTNRFTFTAVSETSTLTFRDTSATTLDTDAALDNVTVEPVRPAISIAVSAVDICWASLTNTAYQVECKSVLTTNAWVPVGTPVQGDGTTKCFTDSTRSEAQKFYRVVELP